MAEAGGRPRFGLLAAVPAGATVVDDLDGAGGQAVEHLLGRQHQLPAQPRAKHFGRRGNRAGRHRPPLGQPLREAAVENRDPVVRERPEGPPDPRGGGGADAVVDDDPVMVADAEPADRGGKFAFRRQHVRQIGAPVADAVDIEEPRAFDVHPLVILARIAAAAGEMKAAVEDADLRVAQVRGEPGGIDERVGQRDSHRCHSSQSGAGKPLLRRNAGLNSLLR